MPTDYKQVEQQETTRTTIISVHGNDEKSKEEAEVT